MDKLFVLESEVYAFQRRHPEYKTYTKVFYNDGTLAGYIAE